MSSSTDISGSPTELLSVNIDCALGRPYEVGARGPDAFDCYGLAHWLIKETLGVELPLLREPGVYDESNIAEVRRAFEEIRVANATTFDLLYWEEGEPVVAVVEDAAWTAQSIRPIGVRRVPLWHAKSKATKAYRVCR